MELGYFDKHLLNTQETKAPQEKNLGVFSIDTLVFPIFKNVQGYVTLSANGDYQQLARKDSHTLDRGKPQKLFHS